MLNEAYRPVCKVIKGCHDHQSHGSFALSGEEPAVRGSRVIAVTSGKGGVGKTSLVVNLAAALSSLGQRVTLFDADLGLANAEVLMGITPPYTLFDCLYGDKEIEDIIVPGPGGVSLVSGGSGFVELANLDSARRQQVIDSLAALDRNTDYLIIDTGAGISRTVLGFVAAANEVIVVVTPEPTSLTDAYTLIKVLSMFKVHSEVMMVVNRSINDKEALNTARKMERVVNQFLQIKVDVIGWICEDRTVPQSVKVQEPYFLYNPAGAPAKSVGIIARRLVYGERTGMPGNGARTFIGKLAKLFS